MPEEVEVLGLAYADLGFTGYKLKQEYCIGKVARYQNVPVESEMETKKNAEEKKRKSRLTTTPTRAKINFLTPDSEFKENVNHPRT